MEAAEAAGPDLAWFVIDMIPVPMIDITGLQTTAEVIEFPRARGVLFMAAGRQTEWSHWFDNRGLKHSCRSFPTLRVAVKAYGQAGLGHAGGRP